MGSLITLIIIGVVIAIVCAVIVWGIRSLLPPSRLATLLVVAVVVIAVLIFVSYAWPLIPHPGHLSFIPVVFYLLRLASGP